MMENVKTSEVKEIPKRALWLSERTMKAIEAIEKADKILKMDFESRNKMIGLRNNLLRAREKGYVKFEKLVIRSDSLYIIV